MEPKIKLALVIAGNFSGDEENVDPTSLLNYLPEDLVDCCQLIEWSCQPSNHYSMKLTMEMESMFETLASDGYTGIIVISGSGVMEEMAYLTDLLWKHPQPVIFANLMVRGRPGLKEGLMNLRCSVFAARLEEAKDKGVMICSSGELFAASEAVMVDPTSPENTFQSPEKGSLGKMLNNEVRFLRTIRRQGFLARRPKVPAAVELVHASLGGGERIISSLASDKEIQGLVIAGFGTGNVPPSWIPHVRNMLRKRIPVAVVSRCFQGQTSQANYFEGCFAKLLEMGVMSGGKLNPYQARIKMALGIASGLTEQGLSLYMLNQPVGEETQLLYK